MYPVNRCQLEEECPEVVVVQNIITSYRIDLFNELHKQLHEKDIQLSVYYYKEKIPGRFLPFSIDEIQYKYKLHNAFFGRVFGRKIYLNPKLLYDVLRLSRQTKLILGVSWNDINVIMVLLLNRLSLIRCDIHLWSEANYMTRGASNNNILKKLLRRFIFNSVSKQIIIPGYVARKTINDIWGYKKEFFILPNLINGSFFQAPERRGSNEKNERIKVVTVARLDERDKGIISFINRAGVGLLTNFEWYIAGDGPDKKRLEQVILEKGLSDNVKLLGNLGREEIRRLYWRCDVFLLPSFSDPNPITVVEAIHAGLAMLLSDRCGNAIEAVDRFENGVVFDPFSEKSVKAAIEFLIASRDSIDKLSFHSLQKSRKEFNLQLGVRSFVGELINS